MVTVEEALRIILAQVRNPDTENVDLLQSAGRVLAQDITADRNYPPFNRVMMDGIAIQSKAWFNGNRSFTIAAIQAAGQPQQQLTDVNNCIEVMTGAMLPVGTDAVIPYEVCTISNGVATFNTSDIKIFQNVHSEGTDSKQGDVLVFKNTRITPTIIGLIAAAGLSKVLIYKLPKIAVCATGDELVEVDQQPLPHQIRQSNSYMLVAALQAEGIQAQRYHLPDDDRLMTEHLNTITSYYDAVLLSGAVSKGKFDHLPAVLNRLGMETLFHGVSQRPGRPFLFGQMPGKALIFGFPGNPVATFMCYQLYFKHWLLGTLQISSAPASAFLSKPYNFKPDLTLHLAVKLSVDQGKLIATPVESSTSGDLVTLAQTEGITSLPRGRENFDSSEAFTLQIL